MREGSGRSARELHTCDDISQLVRTFRRDGYVVAHGWFDQETIGRMDAAIASRFAAGAADFHTAEFVSTAETEVIPWFPQREGSGDFDAVERDPQFNALTTALVGPRWRRDYCMVMFSRRGSAGQAWHQDCAPDDPATYNLNRLVYTRAVDASIGGQVVVVPGSHQRGTLPPGGPHDSLPGEVVLSPGAGDLLMLHGHAWHRILPVTGGTRFSTNYRAAPAGTPDDITDVCVYRNMRYRFSTCEVLEQRA